MRFRSEEKKALNSQNERKVYLFIFVERKKKSASTCILFFFFLTVFNCTQHRITKQHRDDLFIDQSFT